jgi:hypothetical protein
MEMTRKELIAIAEKLATAELVERGLGMLNQPIDAQSRITSQANFLIASDAADKCRSEYQKAFEQWYKEGMPE